MRKCLFALVAMAASSAMAQQNVDITAEQFKSGAAASQLTTLGRQAASSGKRLVVTAPQHWHAQIATSIRAGGDAEVVLKDGFYETLLVRVEDKAEETVKPEDKPQATKPEPPKAEAVKQEANRLPPPATVAPRPAAADLPVPPPPAPVIVEQATPAEAPVIEEKPPVAQAPAVATPAPAIVEATPQPVATPAPATVDPKAPVMLTVAEPGDVDPVRVAMETRYNEGKRINEVADVSTLRQADVIYAGKGVAVVVRREGNRILRMWLAGSLNLNQVGISSEGANKYEVLNSKLD